MHVPGWGFEEARIKFKDEKSVSAFCGLSWLTLNGDVRSPYSFEINAAAATEPAEYEFALFVQASQDAGNQATRLIIDPKIHVTPPI